MTPDPEARFRFALTFYPAMMTRALHLTHHREDAQDLTQTTYLKAWTALSRWDERTDTERGMKALLLRIMDHAWWDELRRRHGYQPAVEGKRQARVESREVPLPDEHPAYLIEAPYHVVEDMVVVAALLSCLTDAQADVVLAVHVIGYTVDDWSEVVGASRKAVRLRLQRANDALLRMAS